MTDGDPQDVSRRTFLALGSIGSAAGLLAGPFAQASAALGVPESALVRVPADKGIPAEAVRALAERGVPTVYRGEALGLIGMPVGGATAGRLYLSGDGRLWLWDIYNPVNPQASQWEGRTYAEPLRVSSPFRQGFALRTRASGGVRTVPLDAGGFADVSFTGKYPIGQVAYQDAASPVAVDLEAFSPFVPTSVDDSSLPATVLAWTIRNTSGEPVEVDLAGWSEAPVCLDSRGSRPLQLLARDLGVAGAAGLEFAADEVELPGEPRPDIVFEDFEGTTYDGWTVEGTAFGPGPVTADSVPDYFKRFGDLHVHGTRFVTSHAFWAGGEGDAGTGKLTSRPFTIERRFVAAGVGGGHWAEQTCVNLVVDGNVVASAAGNDTEPLRTINFDVRRYEGRTARIEIVDANTGAWGHINCDYLVFTDTPKGRAVADLPDFGTFSIAALSGDATVVPSLADASTLDAVFDSGPGPSEIDAAEGTLTGAVRVHRRLAPGESAVVRLLVGWCFPTPRDGQFAALQDGANLRHHYVSRFESARAVIAYLQGNLARLEAATRAWVRTWYDDSTLPHWFLERTLAPASTVATTTCYRFTNGRFYGQEGEYCCDGTCQHVWNYAQSVARLFPLLERDTRERVDLGIAFHTDSGAMDYRGEAGQIVAADGQAGTILRIYREHQMAPDDTFLRRTWPRIRLAIEHLIGRDGEPDGILEGEQYNTLDQSWYGEIPWISGLYVAALRAGAAMASELGDAAFASRCSGLAEQGSAHLAAQLWNAEYGYFVQHLDPAHPDATNSNHGCYVDQLYGETYARQLGLPRIFPADKTIAALRNLYRYNFVTDHEAFRAGVEVRGGRWFAMQGEAGLLLCSWPHGGDAEAPGGGDAYAVGYFNEVWTGPEYEVAAGMLAEGLVDEALVLTRAVYDRYHGSKRNPYNEIECSDHYARAMMSHATYLAMTGYEYHGPRGHLGFAPKLRPSDFRGAFTVAEGWGSYQQKRQGSRQTGRIELRHGRLRLASLAFSTLGGVRSAVVRLGGRKLESRLSVRSAGVTVALAEPVVLRAGQSLEVELRLG